MITKNNVNFNFGQTVRGLNPKVRDLIEDYVDSFLKNYHIIFFRKYIKNILIKYYVSFVYDMWKFLNRKNKRVLGFKHLYYKK